MHRAGGVLDDIDILAPRAAVQLDKEVLIGELDDIPAAERDSQVIADPLGHLGAAGAGNQLNAPVKNGIVVILMVHTPPFDNTWPTSQAPKGS